MAGTLLTEFFGVREIKPMTLPTTFKVTMHPTAEIRQTSASGEFLSKITLEYL